MVYSDRLSHEQKDWITGIQSYLESCRVLDQERDKLVAMEQELARKKELERERKQELEREANARD